MVELYEPRGNQGAYVDAQVERLQTNVFDYNNSGTGVGKTAMTFITARRLGLPLFVVGPTAAEDVWESAAVTQGETIFFTTYGKLATNAGSKINHGLLTRTTFDANSPPGLSGNTPMTTTKNNRTGKYQWVHYYPTELLQTIIQAGVLFVFDEAHKLRNDNQTSQMALAICQEIMYSGSASRIIFASATPISKSDQFMNVANLLGYFGYGNRHVFPGVDMELVYRNGTTTEEEYQANVKKYEVRGSAEDKALSREKAVLELVLQPVASSCKKEDSKWKHVVTDTYVAINPLLHYKATTNLNNLQEILKNKQLGDQFGDKKKDAMHTLETCKIPSVLADVMQVIRSIHNSQVVISAINTSTIMYLTGMIQMMGYDVVRYDGKTSKSTRAEGIEAFNSGKIRILVMNVLAGGTGISLHDTEGGRPRYMFNFPNYRALDSMQSTGRTYRSGVMSDVRTQNMYTQIENEVKMRAAGVQAGENIKGLLSDEEAEDRIMPSSYTPKIPEEIQLTVAGDIVDGVNSVEEANRVIEAHFTGKGKTTPAKKPRTLATKRKTPVLRKIGKQTTVKTKAPDGRR